MNASFWSGGIGPSGEYGSGNIGIVSGKLVASLTLSPKALLSAAAAKIGGTIAPAVATFIENAAGLE